MMGLGGPLAISTADQVGRLPGVDVVVPSVVLLLSDDVSTASMSMPPMITVGRRGPGQGPRDLQGEPRVRACTSPSHDEGSNVTVLGSDLARQYGKHVGDTITLRGETFRVVGILEPTLTAPDNAAVGPPGGGAAPVPDDAAAARRRPSSTRPRSRPA